MTLRLMPIAPVLLGVLCGQIALGVMTPTIPLLLLAHGEAVTNIGLIASCYSVGYFVGALTGERLVIRVGHIRAFAAAAALAADGTLIMALTQSPWAWAALRVAVGYAGAVLSLVAESWLNERADNASRGHVLGAYLVASWGGGAIGPLLMNLVPPSAALITVAGIAFAAATLPMALTHQPNPRVNRQARLSIAALFRVSPAAISFCFTAGVVNTVFYALSPVFLERQGIAAGGIAVFVSAANFAGLAIQFPVGVASDRFGRRRVALVLLLAGCALALAFPLVAGWGLAALLVLGCAYAAATAPLYGLGSGQMNDRLDGGDAVAASGGLLLAWAVGATIGPSAAGWAMQHLGPAGLFVTIAGVLGLIAALTAARMRVKSEVPRDARGDFVPATPVPQRHAPLATGSRGAGRRDVKGGDG
jgi:MFS family permease